MVRTVSAILLASFFAAIPVLAQEAVAVGLQGRVHTVLTEEFRSEDGVHRETTGSTLDVYDEKGFELEFFRYKPDGSLWTHTVYSRNGWQVFKTQTTGTAPFQSNSTQNIFDAEGHAVRTDVYDENGVLVSKSTNELVQQQGESITYRRTESNANGSETTAEITETTDPRTGITHQVQTRDGKLETDWVIERNPDGTGKDKIVYADSSYNDRERVYHDCSKA